MVATTILNRTRLSAVGDRAFPVAAARIWNSLPQHVTSAPSSLVFRSRRHASRLISSPFPIPVRDHVQCSRSDTCHFGHFSRSCYLLNSDSLTMLCTCLPGILSPRTGLGLVLSGLVVSFIAMYLFHVPSQLLL